MTRQENHLIDLQFLLDQREPIDMSRGAVTRSMVELGDLCELSDKLKIPDVYYYRPLPETATTEN